MRVVTLTTDFGLSDWFVAAMKGVILGLNPSAQIVDVTHAIAPGDIRSGAIALTASYVFFPKRTIHVAVVDPGVGSVRPAIVIETANYIFIGPDNGVLSLAVARENIHSVHHLGNVRYFRDVISHTFHGRDVFAPVAAHLSRGVPVSRLGPVTSDFVKLALPEPRKARKIIRGEVIYIDHFGNAITNIHSELFQKWPGERITITAGNKRRLALGKFYAEVHAGSPLGLIDSAGHLEIAVNRGHAARRLCLKVGSPVVVRQTAR